MSTNMNYYEQEQVRAIISDSGINIFYKTCMRQVGVINAECKHCKKKNEIKIYFKTFYQLQSELAIISRICYV